MIRKSVQLTLWFLDKIDFIAPLLTRIVVGSVFTLAGWGKLHSMPDVIQFFQSLGIPYAHYQAPFVAITELLCGSMLILGLLSRIVSIPMICIMIVALATAKKAEITVFSDLFTMSDFLFIPLLLWIVVKGAGFLSADYFIKKLMK